MDNTKLNDLAGRAMGWEQEWKGYPGYSNREPPIGIMRWKGSFLKHAYANLPWAEFEKDLMSRPWNPSTCADDALMLINKAVERWGYWSLDKCSGCYEAVTQGGNREFTGEAETPALSLTLCALRAAGISETEIQEALK